MTRLIKTILEYSSVGARPKGKAETCSAKDIAVFGAKLKEGNFNS